MEIISEKLKKDLDSKTFSPQNYFQSFIQINGLRNIQDQENSLIKGGVLKKEFVLVFVDIQVCDKRIQELV